MRKSVIIIATLACALCPATTLASPKQITGNWRYTARTDEMGDVTKTACTTSLNEVHLGFPYGSTRARLCISYAIEEGDAKGLDVYVELVGRGQILDSEGAEVRFDKDEPQLFETVGAADGSEDTVWLEKEYDVVHSLKKSNRMAVKLTYYQAGNQILLFNTGGLHLSDIADTEQEAVDQIEAHQRARSADAGGASSAQSPTGSAQSQAPKPDVTEAGRLNCIETAPIGQLQSCYDALGH